MFANEIIRLKREAEKHREKSEETKDEWAKQRHWDEYRYLMGKADGLKEASDSIRVTLARGGEEKTGEAKMPKPRLKGKVKFARKMGEDGIFAERDYWISVLKEYTNWTEDKYIRLRTSNVDVKALAERKMRNGI